MAYFIGIDVGTTGTKTVLIDAEGRLKAKATVEYPLYTPKPNWSEQQPEDWWQATVATIRTVLTDSGIKPAEVKGIGLSGQMHGSVFLDKDCQVIRPAILWNDQRTAAECEEITQKVGKERLFELTSNPALTGFTAPKIVWLRNHEPAHFDKVRKVLLPKDYIRFRLTGEFATEVSDASGTLLFDVRHRSWSQQMLQILEIPAEWMPPAYESPEISGQLSATVAEATGLPVGTPVVGGGGDQAAGGVGNGIVEPGILSSVLGTSGVVFVFSEHPEQEPEGRLHTFCHAVPGKWHMMGVMLSAGGSFRWFRDTLGAEEIAEARAKRVDPYELLTAKAEKAPPGAEGLIFLPYLAGERTPYPDPNARGVFFGLSLRHQKAHLIRAVLEGITFGMRDSLELIRSLNVPIQQIRASGGGGKSRFWRQLQADIFGTEVVTINMDEGPAFGVALLAAVGTGTYASVEEACKATIRIVEKTKPNPKNVKIYEQFYRFYHSLYGTFRQKYAELANLCS